MFEGSGDIACNCARPYGAPQRCALRCYASSSSFPRRRVFAGGLLSTSRQLLVLAAKREGVLWVLFLVLTVADPWWAYKCRGGRSAAVVGLSKPERLRALWKACNGCNAGGWLLCEE